MPDIRLRGLTKRYGDFAAVDAIDLDVAQGEFFTLLGPSGSGKTTTLRLIAGFEIPDAGTVELRGSDVTGLPPYARDVNTVFQDYALFPHMSIGDNVEYGLRIAQGPARGAPAPRRRGARARAPDRLRAALARRSSPAASASASRSPARSSTGRRCCCSTSRSARSTSSCARRCRSSSSASRATSASPSSTSRTTRRRR